MATTEYKMFDILRKENDTLKILLVLLNQPLNIKLLSILWKKAVFTVLCDGAANRLYDSRDLEGFQRHFLEPNVVCGDFDSIRDDTKSFFNERCELKLLEDQNETDFTKGARYAMQKCEERNIKYDAIVGYPALGGRFDQTMANINTLYTLQHTPFYLLSNNDLMCLLPPGRNRIVKDERHTSPTCGLVPIGSKAQQVTTTGLKYNLANQSMAFGDLVSTSNSMEPECADVIVITSHYLFWTVEINVAD